MPGLTGLVKQNIAQELEDVAADASPFAKRYVDILPHVDLKRDFAGGANDAWAKNGKTLTAKTSWLSQIMAPVEVKGDYDVIVKFSPRGLAVFRSRCPWVRIIVYCVLTPPAGPACTWSMSASGTMKRRQSAWAR